MSLEIAVAAMILSTLNLGYLMHHHAELHKMRENFVKLARHTKYKG